MKVREGSKKYDQVLRKLPRDAVMISGAQTVAVKYWRGIGAGEWDTIGAGAGWPRGHLESTVSDYLKSDRRLFLDVDPGWWQPCGWHVAEVEELTKLETRFHFRQVAPTVFEIRPVDDSSATDQAHLKNLLPENRPEDVKRCFNPG